MSERDIEYLTEYFLRETAWVNEKVDEAFKNAQDHAYALGLASGKEQRDKLLAALKFARANGVFATFIPQQLDEVIAEAEAA